MRHTRAIVVAAVLLSAAMAAAAAAQLVGEAFDNPGLPLWMQQCVVKASFEPAGYLEYVVLGNSSWVDAVSMQGSPLSIHVDALSWRCAPASAGESAVWIQTNVTSVNQDGIAQFERCYLFNPFFEDVYVRVDYSDEGECPPEMRADKPWTIFKFILEEEPVLTRSGFTAANDACAA